MKLGVQPLEAALDGDEAQRLFCYLKRRDVSSFNHANPPMTMAKRGMIDANASPYAAVDEHIRQNAPQDLTTKATLRQRFAEAAQELDDCIEHNSEHKAVDRLWRNPGSIDEQKTYCSDNVINCQFDGCHLGNTG